MGLLSNRILKASLKPGDHIYSWRVYVYAHHGIYVGDNTVVHFTRGQGQEVGTGTVLDNLISLSVKNSKNYVQIAQPDYQNYVSSCLNCFLGGGILYRFEYDVSPALFIAKVRGGTCTLAKSDDDTVVHRANKLLGHSFRCYNVFKSNCEDFAIYCKTGLLVVEQGLIGQSGQAVTIIGGPVATVFSSPIHLLTTNVYGMVTIAVGIYCASRYIADIGNRMDVAKIEVDDLVLSLGTDTIKATHPCKIIYIQQKKVYKRSQQCQVCRATKRKGRSPNTRRKGLFHFSPLIKTIILQSFSLCLLCPYAVEFE